MKIKARIDRMPNHDGSKVKAIASANIGGAFAIHGIKVIDSEKGLFVQMPQTAYEKDGRKRYSEIFHPITADSRNELNSAVLEAYEQRLHMEENEAQETDYAVDVTTAKGAFSFPQQNFMKDKR